MVAGRSALRNAVQGVSSITQEVHARMKSFARDHLASDLRIIGLEYDPVHRVWVGSTASAQILPPRLFARCLDDDWLVWPH